MWSFLCFIPYRGVLILIQKIKKKIAKNREETMEKERQETCIFKTLPQLIVNLFYKSAADLQTETEPNKTENSAVARV